MKYIPIFLAVALIASAMIVAIPLISANATACSSTTDTVHGITYKIVVKGADGSCASTYADSSHLVHYVLSTSAAQNPYSVKITAISGCTGACPPTEVYVNGWGAGTVFCGGSSGVACSGNGPWKGQVDATVQAGQSCNTAPVFVQYSNTHPSQSNIIILEAGTGGVCGSTTTTTTSSSSTTTTTSSTTTTTTTKTGCGC